jgi:uncharacterized damage-inducible protein DinB
MDLLDRLLKHDAWTTRQLLLLCAGLTGEQLDREFDIGHRSVRATLAHLIWNMEVWSDLMAGQVVEPKSDARRGRCSVPEMIDRVDRAAARLEQVARGVADRDGWDELWTDLLDGQQRSYGGAIAHVITHSMHHRAQLLYLLRRIGVIELPEGDVLSWEQRHDRSK